MYKLKYNLFVWPICVLLLIGFTHVSNNNVFCIDKDGSIKIETACTPCCSSEAEKCDIVTSCFEHNESPECSDVSISYVYRYQRDTHIAAPLFNNSTPNVLYSFINSDDLKKYKLKNNLLSTDPPISNPQIHLSTTVVLTC